jgi:hypothetical protein
LGTGGEIYSNHARRQWISEIYLALMMPTALTAKKPAKAPDHSSHHPSMRENFTHRA